MTVRLRDLPLIRVRITPSALKLLAAEASKQNTTNAALAGRILSECLASDAESEARRLAARRPKPSAVNVEESPLDLAKRGYSASQISARLRMPYRQVMAALGEQVDQAVREASH